MDVDTVEIEDFDYGELKNDTAFINKNENLSECIERIRQNLAIAREDYKNYESFTLEEKVKYDLHLSYSINSLYWMYHKIIGLDPNKHGIKDELARIKAAMIREKEVYDHKYSRPLLDQGAAKRFIRAGLYDHKHRDKPEAIDPPPNKKIRFDD
ncbi:nuclear nucleic acid-binding protein C1D-like [Topomyia yanbarensis]|uniref:nuclear nucleic acid-binding protein C1D-like n=1 Tax=Topomyia yanbarensis TaxID=2498891 RepID=UPI00273CE5F9|nr:nuclear nucleic acid-binding protein C1D-like [Topomyia yanbarensis]